MDKLTVVLNRHENTAHLPTLHSRAREGLPIEFYEK